MAQPRYSPANIAQSLGHTDRSGTKRSQPHTSTSCLQLSVICGPQTQGGEIVGGDFSSCTLPLLRIFWTSEEELGRRGGDAKDKSGGGGGISGCELELGGGEEGVQFSPHGGTEVLLVSGYCLADCPHRLPVFFCFTVHCLPIVSVAPDPHHRSHHRHSPLPSPVQMAILTAQKTAPLCHPLPPGAFAIFFNQPLHSGWVATVCTVLAGAV